MKVYRISKCVYINDLSGKGAAMNGGRWNSEGVYMLYTAGSASLAMLEALVHFGGRIRGAYCQLVLEIPDHSILNVEEWELPLTWRDHPPPDSLSLIGNQFIRDGQFMALKVPSVLVPEEFNFLLNPGHPGFEQIQVIRDAPVKLDDRFASAK